jgi:hypothetical protein
LHLESSNVHERVVRDVCCSLAVVLNICRHVDRLLSPPHHHHLQSPLSPLENSIRFPTNQCQPTSSPRLTTYQCHSRITQELSYQYRTDHGRTPLVRPTAPACTAWALTSPAPHQPAQKRAFGSSVEAFGHPTPVKKHAPLHVKIKCSSATHLSTSLLPTCLQRTQRV